MSILKSTVDSKLYTVSKTANNRYIAVGYGHDKVISDVNPLNFTPVAKVA